MPTPVPNLQELIAWLVGIASSVFGVFKLVKHIMKTVEADKLTSTAVNSDITSYKRLQEQVASLTAEMAQVKAKAADLERRWNLLRDIELAGAQDLGRLTAYLDAIPCGNCQSPMPAYANIQAIIQRMIDRHDERTEVFVEVQNPGG